MDALNSEENYLNGKKRIAHKSQTTEESVTKRKEIIKGIRNSYISKNKKNDKIQIKKRSKLLTLIRTSLEKRGNQQIILDTRVSSNMKSPKHYGVQHFGDNIKQASPKGMDNKPNKRNEDLATKTVKAKRPFYESNLVYSDISSSEEGEFSSSPKKAKIVSLTRKESEVITPAKIYKKSPLASKLNSNRSSLDSFYSAGTDVWDELSNLSTETSEIVKEDKLNEPRDIKIVDEYTIGDFPKGSDDYDSCKSVVKNNSETENLSSSLVPQNKELNSDVQSQLEEIKNKTKNKLVSIKHESSIEQPVKKNLTKLITPKFELPPRTKEELAQQSKIIESYYEYDSTDDEDPDAIPDPVTILSSTLPEAPNVLMTAPKIEALPEPKIRIPPLSINSSTLDSSNQVVDITSDDEEMKNVEKVIHTTLTPPVTPSTTPFSPVDIMVTSNVLLSPAVMGWSSNNDDEVIIENDDEVIVENDDEVIVENDDTIDLTTDLANFLNAEIDLTNDVSNSTYKVAQLVVSKSNSETMAIPIFTGTIFPQITPQVQTPNNQYNANTTEQLYGLPIINEKSDNLKESPKQTYSASFYPQNSSTNLTNLTNKVTSPTGNLAQGFVSTPNSNLMTISTYVPQVQIMHNIKLKPFLHGTTKQSKYCDKMLQRNKLLDYYKCMDDDCYFTTNELEEFVIHLGKHQSSKSCKICPYCDFSVLQGDSSFLLLEHMVKNHNTKPQYQCGFCFHRAESINEAVQHKNAYHTMNNQVIHEIADRAEGKGRKMPLFEDQVQYVQVNQNHANPQKIYIAPNYSNPMTDTSEKQSSVYNQQPNPNQKHTPPTIWVRDTKHLMNTSVNNSSGYYNQNMSNLPQSEHQNTSYSTNGQNAGYQVQAANSLPTQMNNSQTIPFGEQFGTNSYIRYNFN